MFQGEPGSDGTPGIPGIPGEDGAVGPKVGSGFITGDDYNLTDNWKKKKKNQRGVFKQMRFCIK